MLHAEPRPDLTVVLTGGVRTPSDALVGPIAVDDAPLAARRRALHGRARHRPPTPASRRRTCSRPRPTARSSRRRRASSSSPTTPSGACAASAASPRLDEVDVFVTDRGPRRRRAGALAEPIERASSIAPRRRGATAGSRVVTPPRAPRRDARAEAARAARRRAHGPPHLRRRLAPGRGRTCRPPAARSARAGSRRRSDYDVRWFREPLAGDAGRALRGRALHAASTTRRSGRSARRARAR